jgi:hypothetical protein
MRKAICIGFGLASGRSRYSYITLRALHPSGRLCPLGNDRLASESLLKQVELKMVTYRPCGFYDTVDPPPGRYPNTTPGSGSSSKFSRDRNICELSSWPGKTWMGAGIERYSFQLPVTGAGYCGGLVFAPLHPTSRSCCVL